MPQKKIKLKVIFFFVALVIFLCEELSLAQLITSTLPLEAQEALNKGYAAAKQQQWDLAIKYFSEAQGLAPTSPYALLNLALAYDKAGGLEVSAIPWYLAYTASYPKAPNIYLVRKRIAELEIAVESNARKLLEYAEKAREIIRENPTGFNWAVDLCIAFAQVRVGDINKAYMTLKKIKPDQQKYILEEIAIAEAKKGNVINAKKIAIEIKSSKALLEILKKLLNQGKISEAMQTASLVGLEGYYETAKYLALTGNIKSATEAAGFITPELMVRFGNPFKDNMKDLAFYEIIKIQAVTNNLSGARKTASYIKSEDIKTKANQYIKNVETKGSDIVLSEEEIEVWTNIDKYYDRLSGCGDALSAISDLIGKIVIQDLVKYLKPSKEEKDPWNYIHCLVAGASSMMKVLDIIRENKLYWEMRKTRKR